MKLSELKAKIRTIPNWPKPGIMFRDITTLLKDPAALKSILNKFYERYKNKRVDAVAAIESRGFILGGALAARLGVGFIPLRKPGKLPAASTKIEYKTEYSTDGLEIHNDAIEPGQNILIIDDLIATSGTCLAAANLIEKLGGKVVECSFIIELPDLKGREKLEGKGYNVFSLIHFLGD